MIHQGEIGAARRAAQHCEALLRQRPPVEMTAQLADFGERLALTLRRAMVALGDGAELQAQALGSRTISAADLAQACGPLCANSLYAFGRGDRQLVLSLDGRALLERLDRAFGGNGDLGDDLPDELPVSADLFAQRLAKQAIAAISGETGGTQFHAGRRDGKIGEISPYRATSELTLIEVEIGDGFGTPLRMLVALETEALAELLPQQPGAAARRPVRKFDVNEAPFAEVPLPASATLVDMNISLHRLAGLQPGMVLPIMVARNVPLQVGEATIARGTVGEVDDQIALQITQTFSGKER